MLDRFRTLYEGDTPAAQRFRYALLGVDLLAIVFVIVSSFFARTRGVEMLDAAFGVVFLADFAIRLRIEADKARFMLRLTTWADIVSIVSFLAPIVGEGLGFLRILRTVRLLHSYQMMARLQKDFAFFREHGEVMLAAVNLGVFIFVMTGVIYASEGGTNPGIQNYADALYFTVTALTTTGFGDITLTGTTGRLLSVAVMIVGVTLFLRLAQVLFRPSKVRQECGSCGLMLHDADAVHCKHCGAVIHIRTEGAAD